MYTTTESQSIRSPSLEHEAGPRVGLEASPGKCFRFNIELYFGAAMMHLTFQNTVDNKYYKLAGFARGQLRSEQCRFEKGGRPVSVADY